VGDPRGAAPGDTAAAAGVVGAAGTPPAPPRESPPERRGFFTPARLIAMVLLLLLLGGVLAYALTRPESVLVPTVIGKSQADAQGILEDAGFEVAVRSVPNEAEPGTVLEQDPLAGSKADKGSTVTITASTGLGTVPVPDVAGKPEKRALKTLRDAGLRPKERQRSSGTVTRGLAIATVPEAGAELERGTPITLFVSTGPKLVQVPPVIGEQQDAADTAIRDAGLIPDFENRDSDAPVGEVIAQNPGAGSTVKQHTTVTVVVSNGAGTAVVPNVVGESKDQAKGDLKTAGLSVRIVQRTTTDENEDGTVLDQSPSAGTRLRRGEFVTIFVGKFKAPPPTTSTTIPTVPP
jgi:beta-lactam-binding protein with PASTA domain